MLTRHHVIPALLALALLGGSAAAMAQAPAKTYTRAIDKNETVSPSTLVKVENLVGHVKVSQGGEQLAIHANVVAGGADAAAAKALANTIKLTVNRDGNQLNVHVDYPIDKYDSYQYLRPHQKPDDDGISFLGIHINTSRGHSTLRYQDQIVNVYRGSSDGVPLHVDLAIQLPKGIDATIYNHIGSADARHLANTLTLRSDDGDMHAQAIQGKLTIRTGDGDVNVDNLRGDLDLRTGDGDVKANDIQGSTLAIHTGDGDVRMEHLQGSLDVHTGDGNISADTLQGKLDLRTGDGDVTLTGLRGVPAADVATGDGDIRLSGDLSRLQNFSLRSGNGDIHLSTQTPPAVHLDINAGTISVDWPGMRNVKQGRRSYRGDVGAATGKGRIRTGSGDVVLGN